MRSGLLLLLGFVVPLECFGIEFLHQDTVLMTDIDPDPDVKARLGWAVAVNDGDVFIGAPEVVVNEKPNHGATYQYRISNQRQLDFVRSLDPQDASPGFYGMTIVTQGEVTAVGSFSDQLIELYVRKAGNWELGKVLTPPELNDVRIGKFGLIMDLDGDFLVVGDPEADIGTENNVGLVMIFGRNTGGADNWGLITHFQDPAPPLDAKFAGSVAISSDLMVVGDDVAERALLYRRSGNTWSYDKALQAEGAEADDGFGTSVEAEGDTIAVSALNGNDVELPTNAGSVHMFHRNEGGSNNFGQVAQITPSEPEFIDRFGESMRLRQDLLVVGAPGAQQAYVFSRLSGNWTEEQQILPPEGSDFFNAEFGFDVDYDHGSIMVGSNRWPDIDGDRYGAVFLYEDPGIVLCGHLDGIFCDGYESQ